MVGRLFAYGTLLVPELLCAVLGRALSGVPAVLSGYACFRVRRAAYPAIVGQPGATTHGELFTGIVAPEWNALDDFESSLYERHEVRVRLPDESIIEAHTFVVADPFRHRLTDEPWDLENFRRKHLDRYLTRLGSGRL